MDELEDDSNGPDTDVAALMGFNSFGDQHRGKRRRYNGRAEDAVVDGRLSLSPSGKKKEKGRGSGSNNLPLGSGRARAKNNDGVTAVETSVGGTVGTRTQAKSSGTGRGSEDAQEPGDGGGDGMAPVGLLHAAARQVEQKTQSASDMLRPARPSGRTSRVDTSLPPKPAQHSLSRSQNTAPAPASATGPRKGIGTGTENEAWRLRKGIKLANGDVAYYDASFVEDPWRELR